MQAKVGTLISTVMPTFPEAVFDADSPNLKDALLAKTSEIKEKFGKYGSLKPPAADPAAVSMLSADMLANKSAMSSFKSGMPTMPAELASASDLAAMQSGLSTDALSTDSLPIGGLSSAMDLQAMATQKLGENQMLTQEQLHNKALEKLAIQEEFADVNIQMQKLESMGLSADKLETFKGLSAEQLEAGTSIMPAQLAAAGITASQLSEVANVLPETTVLPDTNATVGNIDAMQNVSMEKLSAVGLDEEELAKLQGMTPEQLELSSAIDSEELMNAGITPAQLSLAAGLSGANVNPDSAQVQQLAGAGITPEQLASGAAIPAIFAANSNQMSNDQTADAQPADAQEANEESAASAVSGASEKSKAEINAKGNISEQPILIRLSDDIGNPICGQAYELTLADGSVLKGSTDDNGLVLIAGKCANKCSLSIPNLDSKAW